MNLQINKDRYIVRIEYNSQYMFIAKDADISKICYKSILDLPRTQNIQEAKLYNTIDEAKDDIYKLKYYHREFLRLKYVISKLK